MKSKVHTLVVGATYFGIGYAAAHRDCLVLESSQIMGGDFRQGAKTADISQIGAKEANCELGSLMKEYHVWEDGKFDSLKATPVLHEYVNRKGRENVDVYMDIKILSIRKTNAGYVVRTICNEGITDITCERMIDTTVLRETYPGGAKCTSKTLNMFTVCLSADFDKKMKAVCPNCIIEEGVNEGERMLKFPFAPETSAPDAYQEVMVIWNKAFPNGEEKILFAAGDFDYVCERVNEENAPCPWNGGSFGNPLSAFAAGTEYQL